MRKLKQSTLKKYARSALLERNTGEGHHPHPPIYFHSQRCPSFCDYACNEPKGFRIAEQIAKMESA